MEQVVSHALDGERALQLARAALAAYDLPSRIQIRPIRLLNNAVFEVSGDGLRLALRIQRVGYRSFPLPPRWRVRQRGPGVRHRPVGPG